MLNKCFRPLLDIAFSCWKQENADKLKFYYFEYA